MVRSLPKKHNPYILPDGSPSYEDLVARRRLGKTHLAVKPTQIGMSNATKPENLGPFEYAHLRAPLPGDLKGSEIFPSYTPQDHPTYFLMRRSKDGYVSATGMFKIAFPWARLDEERSERDYLKARKETSEDEIAGNIWISPTLALELAKEYQMYDWVRALLDPTEIIQSPSKQITSPPKFELPPLDTAPELPPSTRTRSRRSASPSKRPASPRKSRQTRAAKEASSAAASAATETLQSTLNASATTAESETIEETAKIEVKVNGEEKPKPRKSGAWAARKAAPKKEEEIKVNGESAEEAEDAEAAKATVSTDEPSLLPELPPEANPEALLAEAKKMVEKAKEDLEVKGEAADSSAKKQATKRKTEDLTEDEEDEKSSEDRAQRVKRAKILEEKLKRERVRNRALVGVTAALAIA
ncbi:hypothetical protein MPDQ_006143 [Monascus purpureus]|uniref:Cell pattern formation-associated protein stuA n=1 Tax=Monascus purpureus TaxID=5098 RepID=A0A507R4U8_MONPU|nr:hypothetical protein MPDQ_006143 [Monascus purpureus]BDD62751.1 hypothetical protein MAP00_007712 [Monascus purpureus]